MGSLWRALLRCGSCLNAPRSSSTAVGSLGRDMDSINLRVLRMELICHGPVGGLSLRRDATSPHPSLIYSCMLTNTVMLTAVTASINRSTSSSHHR
jgi:hypothetical protein